MSRDLYWIWFSLRMGIGKSNFVHILEHFGSPENIYAADAEELNDFFDEKQQGICRALCDKDLDEAYKIEAFCLKYHISILKYSEKGYPKLLTNLKNPPIILYAKGMIADLDDRVSIGVVGTRSISEYGRQSAYKIGYELAAAGAVVVSGLALGNDSVAACGALDAGGRTVAILGSGVNCIYPAAHKKLAQEIASRGMLLSEYPPLTPPSREAFPMRNRIISGMSHGTLVTEAGEKSGALITARNAIMQGREVYALPGNINVRNAVGTNELIKSGATPVTCAADVLETYQYLYGNTLDLGVFNRVSVQSTLRRGALASHGVDEGRTIPPTASSRWGKAKSGKLTELLRTTGHVDGETVKRVSGQTEYPVYHDDHREVPVSENDPIVSEELPGDLSEHDTAILKAMPKGKSVGVDVICECGFDAEDVITTLTMLEVAGLVTSLPGNLYMRK